MTLDQYVTRWRQVAEAGLARTVLEVSSRAVLRAEDEAKELATTRLRVRTGFLRRSITGTVATDGPTTTLTMRAGGGDKDVKYAALQEYGGVVKPKGHPFLAVPVGPALTAAGAPRYPGGARTVPVALAFALSRKGNPMLVERDARRGKAGGLAKAQGRVWFMLYRSVTIEPHRYIRDPFDAMREKVGTEYQAAVETMLGGL